MGLEIFTGFISEIKSLNTFSSSYFRAICVPHLHVVQVNGPICARHSLCKTSRHRAISFRIDRSKNDTFLRLHHPGGDFLDNDMPYRLGNSQSFGIVSLKNRAIEHRQTISGVVIWSLLSTQISQDDWLLGRDQLCWNNF